MELEKEEGGVEGEEGEEHMLISTMKQDDNA